MTVDAYKVSLGGEDNQFFDRDPRLVLPTPVHICRARRATWHGYGPSRIVVWDLVYKEGELWSGYETHQLRGYSDFEAFLSDPETRPADYYDMKWTPDE